MDKIVERVLLTVVAMTGLCLAWIMFFILPIAFNAESKCLARGYPDAKVDYKGNAYCVKLDGTTYTVVEK